LGGDVCPNVVSRVEGHEKVCVYVYIYIYISVYVYLYLHLYLDLYLYLYPSIDIYILFIVNGLWSTDQGV